MLVLKTPDFDERTTSFTSPLASSILSLLLYPIYLVYCCRKQSDSTEITPKSLPYAVSWKPVQNKAPVSSCPEEGNMASQLQSSESMDVQEISPEKEKSSDSSKKRSRVIPESTGGQEEQSVKRKLSDSLNKIACYAFGDNPVYIPASFINLALYNLVDVIFSNSKHSQVYNYLVPCIQDSKLLLKHPTATHALLQGIDMVIAKEKSSQSADKEISAPFKLVVLLQLVPIGTELPTTSLQLYLQACRRLVHKTSQFLPCKSTELETVNEGDSEEELSPDEDSDDENFPEAADDDITPPHILELGKWCLAHMNCPEYVSWLLRLVEGSHLDRDVLAEFCGLTHTMLTAPSLSLFQCR